MTTDDTFVSTNMDGVIERLQRALGEPPSNEPQKPSAVPVTILVMDDAVVDRRSMVRVLKNLPSVLQIFEAGTLAEAREIIAQRLVNYAFFDFSLPDGEGVSLLPLAHEYGVTAVIVTGAGNERVAVRAMADGAADYVVKDVAGEYLALLPLTLGQVMQRRALETERASLLARVEDALSTIRLLGSFVRICCVCKKIKTTNERWESIESYLMHTTNAKFSHGYCTECFKQAEKDFA